MSPHFVLARDERLKKRIELFSSLSLSLSLDCIGINEFRLQGRTLEAPLQSLRRCTFINTLQRAERIGVVAVKRVETGTINTQSLFYNLIAFL